ncbi:MAG: nitroreductase [Chloroflexi bacterium]|nr:nitroreductase [Chloroflexota bacterium]
MEVVEAIRARKSVRAFRPLPVPRDVLTEILEIARRAPSCENTQPWELAIVTGRVLVEMRETIDVLRKANEDFRPELGFPVPQYRSPYLDRARQTGREILQTMGIQRGDQEGRMGWYRAMARFFDAPVAMVVYVDQCLGAYGIMDVGLFLENLALAALTRSLGTCIHLAGVLYPDVLRASLNIPDSKRIVCGMSIGYPDESHPSWGFNSRREPPEAFATWYGWD